MPNVGLRLPGSNPEMQVSPQAVPALEQLAAAAKHDGLDLIVASAYRSYQAQVSVYNAEVSRNGQQAADRESARPGHSEHQTGLAIDIGAASRKCEVQACFADMPEGQWVAANAYKYGFIIRYAQTTEAITGYTYEPWHLRFVGKELATELHAHDNPPLEIFFGLGAAPDYQ
jgi:D-alanyl-D-alanine carboxypeptidase